MNGYPGTVVEPGVLYVRALYDYDADDRTSLSFRQGDVIQVITQLESGWWDGVINGVRGWFPSNYCAVVPRPANDDGRGGGGGAGGKHDGFDNGDDDDEDEDDDDIKEGYDGDEYGDADSEGIRDDTGLPLEGTDGDREHEEAAFWIPQAMPDGRLYYFNTLTLQSTMELPLETPSSGNENGPRERTNVHMPDSTRPPPELIAGGYNEDDTDYESIASDADAKSRSGGQVRCNALSLSYSHPSANR